METVFDVIQSLQLSFSQMVVVGVLIFFGGFLVGTIRVRKLIRENHGLEKAVMALNEELLYGNPPPGYETKEAESTTPVIGLKSKNYLNSQIAK